MSETLQKLTVTSFMITVKDVRLFVKCEYTGTALMVGASGTNTM